MLAIIWSIIAFVLAISILIAFHEWGHFLVARAFGIKVVRFSIGFGKILWSFKGRKGTEYALSILPLGGYVKFLDENEEKITAEDRSKTFNIQPPWVKMLVVTAGPLFNLVFAVLAYWLMFVIGISSVAPILGHIDANSAVAKIGLHQGDEIIAINNNPINSWQAVSLALIRYVGDIKPVAVQVKTADKQQKTYYLDLQQYHLSHKNVDLTERLGFTPYLPPIKPHVAHIIKGGAADKAGIKIGDVITAIAGKPIQTWEQMSDELNKYINKPIAIDLLRNQEKFTLHIIPESYKTIDGSTVARIGIKSDPIKMPKEFLRTTQYSIFSAWAPAFNKTLSMISLTITMLYKMASGAISLKALSGPIGIAQGAGYSIALGFSYYLEFIALISISLGVVNILPIPILDGGHFLFYLIEAIRGKPLTNEVQVWCMKIGLILLLAVMFYAIYNDVNRIFS